MLREFLVAFVLVSINVSIHATGMVELFEWLLRKRPKIEKKFGTVDNIILFIEIFAIILSLHLAEICVWAGFYTHWGILKDFEPALYFSISTYTTIGYGDIVLPVGWRLLGAIEGVTGVLTFGWSTGVIFAVASRLMTIRVGQNRQ
ncbi:MAG TPA: potassium channel family protein [Thermodesulfobacteriota bacterium]|nr:potassium channel family protein [Thermodesulfobacteriota bacterium]